MILRVLEDGRVHVTVPEKTTETQIIAFIERKKNWVVRQQEKLLQLQKQREQYGLQNQYTVGGHIVYLGQQYPLVVKTDGKQGWYWNETELCLTGCCEEKKIRQMVEAFYRVQLLKKVLPALCQEVEQLLQLLPIPKQPVIQVRKMRATWGLCYYQEKKIVCNLWLAMAPQECIRQVLVHEYLHFYEKNHTTQFYTLLQNYEPQYRLLEQQLLIAVNLRALRK